MINFLAVDRTDLIGELPYKFVVTEHVDEEIQDHYPERYQRYQEAIAAGVIEHTTANDPIVVETFAKLAASGRLGNGECSSIAVAGHGDHILAIDDKRARKSAEEEFPSIPVKDTADLMVEAIRNGLISLEDADQIKQEWADHHRFRLKLDSFSEML